MSASLCLALTAAFLATSLAAADAPTGDALKGLKPKHPRLLVLEEDWTFLKEMIAKDKTAGEWHKALLKRGEDELKKDPIVHRLIGPRLLDQSRLACSRVSLWAALYRLGGDMKFAERARKEMLTAASFKDWNPSHFLDTAEMSWALALGYDWLFDVLSKDERETIRKALVEKGLKPGLDVYRGKGWWAKCDHNWNQVCNGGLVTAALAIADEEPEVAGQVVAFSRDSIPRAMASYAPDGGWSEGPGYWSYATAYNVNYVSAIETALGTDFGLKKLPGFAECGMFRMHSAGPNGKSFNFADAGEGTGAAPMMFWLARAFQKPAYAAHEMTALGSRASIQHLLWGFMKPPAVPPPAEALKASPLDAVFRHIHVAFFRSAWDDPKAAYVGFKGGDNKANHSHLDLGTFVLDALGQRWVSELGGDNYNLPAYFGNKRWTYYRLKTEGQNTLVLDGANQDPKAAAPIVAFQSKPERAFAVADLSAGYKANATRVLRGVALLNRRDVLIVDEVDAAKPVTVVWGAHTKAMVEVKERTALLSLEGAKMEVRLLAPENARFEKTDAKPADPPDQNPNKDVTKLLVKLPEKTAQTRIVVLFTPEGSGAASPPVEPLEKWIGAGKLEPLPGK
jgi:hypothetical protein